MVVMNKGFMEFDKNQIADMLEIEYEDIGVQFAAIDVEILGEFAINVIVIGATDNRIYTFNGLSDFDPYSGAYVPEDVEATHKLFADMVLDAAIELKIK